VWGRFQPALAFAGAQYPDVDETGDSYEVNAVLKATALAEITQAPALADDSGIEVEAMGWRPGVRSARSPSAEASAQERNRAILAAVEGKSRTARFVCVCALVVPGFAPITARGEVDGLIASSERGKNGFGYDPIFFFPGYDATFAEVTAQRKHAVSHRGRAVRSLQAMISPLVE